MLYRLFHFVAGFALRWFYRDTQVVGLERVPAAGPLIVAANHPNALIDVLVIGRTLPRRLTLTGKATLFANPVLRWLLTSVGFVPLQRAKDLTAAGQPANPARNREAFRAVLDALADGRAVLIFPEGISHDAPSIAPLKTGAARMALQARDERGLRAVRVLPVGLSYERKWATRSRVVLEIGEPVDMDAWVAPAGESAADALTAEIDARLRAVTLNFATAEERERVLGLSRMLTPLFDEPRPLSESGAPLPELVSIARRVADAQARHDRHESPATRARVEAFERRLASYRELLDVYRLSPADVCIDLGARPAAWFVVRELFVAAVAGPLALWGRANHWLAFRLTRAVGARLSRTPEDPAMITVVVGAALVLAFYALQTTLVWKLAGPWWALAYLVTLPPSANWDLHYSDRLRRARARTRTYLTLRRDPALHARLVGEVQWLRGEVVEIERELGGVPSTQGLGPSASPHGATNAGDGRQATAAN
jgi:glycerol-3-phosphate O-acyltransferase / dihydroxyacetone phosphate acyltransferase